MFMNSFSYAMIMIESKFNTSFTGTICNDEVSTLDFYCTYSIGTNALQFQRGASIPHNKIIGYLYGWLSPLISLRFAPMLHSRADTAERLTTSPLFIVNTYCILYIGCSIVFILIFNLTISCGFDKTLMGVGLNLGSYQKKKYEKNCFHLHAVYRRLPKHSYVLLLYYIL